MISLNHVLAGTAIGLCVKEPALVIPLAFLSHFILDTFPHFSYEWPGWSFRRIWFIDVVLSALALGLLCLAAPGLSIAIIAGGFFSELPDVLWLYENLIIKARSQFWYFRFHRKIQWSETRRGLLYETCYAIALVALNIWLLPK